MNRPPSPYVAGQARTAGNTRRATYRPARPVWLRWTLMGAGWLLVSLGILIGPLPGPGPVIMVPLGLALILKNSVWAKRVYIRFRARHGEFGQWSDWALGRRHRQRERPPLPSMRELLRRARGSRRRG